MTAFIAAHRDVYGVEPICKVLPIAPSTYYAHAARKADPDLRPNRALKDDALCVKIRWGWDENQHCARPSPVCAVASRPVARFAQHDRFVMFGSSPDPTPIATIGYRISDDRGIA